MPPKHVGDVIAALACLKLNAKRELTCRSKSQFQLFVQADQGNPLRQPGSWRDDVTNVYFVPWISSLISDAHSLDRIKVEKLSR